MLGSPFGLTQQKSAGSRGRKLLPRNKKPGAVSRPGVLRTFG
jgi:hypothetical protein